MGVYWKVGLSNNAPLLQSVAQVSAVLDGHGWAGSWRASDDSSNTLWNASNPNNPQQWLFSYFPSVWIVETATMKIVKCEELDGQLNVLTEVTALNN